MPSSSTSVRETPEGATPRRFKPCEEGSALRLLERRKVRAEGTVRSAESVVSEGLRSSSSRVKTVTVAAEGVSGRASREAVATAPYSLVLLATD
jgi:hypothetical protein